MRLNEIAAEIHRRMCEDDRFGYSWEERYGAIWETWEIDGKSYRIKVGDYDCSSSTITAWSVALQHTPWEGLLSGAHTTHDMRAVFVGSGLFEWRGMDFLAETGDLYLNEANHVAMCQTQYPDVLSEFSWGDNGAYGNVRGDQSGWEASVHGYYDYEPDGWDGILHFVGGDAGSSSGFGSDEDAPADLPMPRFRVAIKNNGKKHWLPWMRGLVDEGGSSDTYAGVEGCGIVDIEFEGGSLGSDGWFTKSMKGDKLIGLTVYYDTPEPDTTGYYQAMYRCHWMGKNPAWGKYEYDDDDGGARNDRDQLDMVELTICKA